MNARNLAIGSGMLWLVLGAVLLWSGVGLMTELLNTVQGSRPLLHGMASLTKDIENAGQVLLCFALCVGYIGGRYALGNASMKVYGVVTAVAVVSVAAFSVLGVSPDIRGVVAVLFGAAFIQGAVSFIRTACTKVA